MDKRNGKDKKSSKSNQTNGRPSSKSNNDEPRSKHEEKKDSRSKSKSTKTTSNGYNSNWTKHLSSTASATVTSNSNGEKDSKSTTTTTSSSGSAENGGKSSQKASMVYRSTVGSTQFSSTIQFETNEVPAAASSEMYTAIFKNAKNFGAASMTKDDLAKAELDVQRFWQQRLKKRRFTSKDLGMGNDDGGRVPFWAKKKRPEETQTKPSASQSSASQSQSSCNLDDSMDMETRELFRQADELLGKGAYDPNRRSRTPSTEPDTSSVLYNTRKLKDFNFMGDANEESSQTSAGRRKLTKRAGKGASDAIVLSSDEEDAPRANGSRATANNTGSRRRSPRKRPADEVDTITLTDSDENPSEFDLQNALGQVVLFQVEILNRKYPIRIYENQFIREVRAMVSMKSGYPAETIDMFLGETEKLEDGKTVKESGIKNLVTIDAYYKEKSDKEIFEAGSLNILRFKLQTSDRRGRQDCFIYIHKDAVMKKVRDQYATERGVDPSTVKLMFDGDVLDLSNKPADCDLEGDECIDVVCSA